LKSGLESPVYRPQALLNTSGLLTLVAEEYVTLPIQFPSTGWRGSLRAIATAISAVRLAFDLPSKRVRLMEPEAVEGEYEPGEKVVVIDDLATTGGSK
jgi:uridine monophosphate synthetase